MSLSSSSSFNNNIDDYYSGLMMICYQERKKKVFSANIQSVHIFFFCFTFFLLFFFVWSVESFFFSLILVSLFLTCFARYVSFSRVLAFYLLILSLSLSLFVCSKWLLNNFFFSTSKSNERMKKNLSLCAFGELFI